MAYFRRCSLLTKLMPTRVYVPGVHKTVPKRLNWDKIEAKPPREGRNVVKGTNKRVVVVKSPDPKVFEQAIFIVREDFHAGNGKEVDALKEAEKVANDYLRSAVTASQKFFSKVHPAVFGAVGAIMTGIVWLTLHFLGY